MRIVRKWLILSHRYLGIALCLLLVMWFGSGIVMIYAGGMPALTPEARRAHLPGDRFQPRHAERRRRRGARRPRRAAERHAAVGAGTAGLPVRWTRTGDGLCRYRRDDGAGVGRRIAPHREPLPRRARIAARGRRPAHDAGSVDAPARAPRRPAEVHGGRRRRHARSTSRRGPPTSCSPRPAAIERSPGSASSRTGCISAGCARNQPLWYRTVVWTSERRVRAGAARPGARRHAVAAHATVPAVSRRAVRGLDALALHHRRRLRRVRAHVGVQRPAVDGALRVDERQRARSGRRGVHRRRDRAVAVQAGGRRPRGPRSPTAVR